MADLRSVFAPLVGSAHVVTDPDITAGHVTDWTGRYRGRTAAVVRPASTEEVAAVVAACGERGLALVPQGGNTGLVGGGIAHDGEVVLHLGRLGRLRDLDPVAATAEAEAGMTLGQLDHAAAGAGLAVGLDLGSRDAATIGGMVATNAAGTRLLRYGAMRAQLVDAEAVLADGSVVGGDHPLLKDNTGYHLPGLWCGSEGTLAVVTAARLRLWPRHPTRVTALVGLPDADELPDLVADLRRRAPSLESVEVMTAAGVELVGEVTGAANPLPGHAVYVLAEVAGGAGVEDELAGVLGDRAAVAVAVDPGPRADLWALRERHSESIRTRGPTHKLDVTVPVGTIPSLLAEMPAVVAAAAPGASTWLFGHAGDGNVHVNVTGVEPGDDRVDDAVLRWVVARGGSISAEHGIGVAKQPWLALARSPAERAVFARLKAALDPAGILNPAVSAGLAAGPGALS